MWVLSLTDIRESGSLKRWGQYDARDGEGAFRRVPRPVHLLQPEAGERAAAQLQPDAVEARRFLSLCHQVARSTGLEIRSPNVTESRILRFDCPSY